VFFRLYSFFYIAFETETQTQNETETETDTTKGTHMRKKVKRSEKLCTNEFAYTHQTHLVYKRAYD